IERVDAGAGDGRERGDAVEDAAGRYAVVGLGAEERLVEGQCGGLADQRATDGLDRALLGHLPRIAGDDDELVRRERRPGGDALRAHDNRPSLTDPHSGVAAVEDAAGDADRGAAGEIELHAALDEPGGRAQRRD